MPFYLDDTQRKRHPPPRRKLDLAKQNGRRGGLIVAVYGGWFGVATHARALGLPLTVSLLAVLGVLYMSLQHELMHGHPTRSRFINGLIGFAPLAIWFPYALYRNAHLKHHDDPFSDTPGVRSGKLFRSATRMAARGRCCYADC